jgi:hypothetical protein
VSAVPDWPAMGMDIESRPSDSPHIERVWRCRSSEVDRMTALANPRWELVFWTERGVTSAVVRGPESRAGQAPVPQDAEFFGINFALGTALPQLATHRLVDGAVPLPAATDRTFWLCGSARRIPDFDNAEQFVARLVATDAVVADPLVVAALGDSPPRVSARTVQRHVVATTGLTRGEIHRIERARRAAVALQEGEPAHRVAHRLGYFDQPHLARSLTRYVGRTATRLAAGVAGEPLSLLYKT